MNIKTLRNTILFGSLLASSVSNAGMILSPVRCAVDSLGQWNHDVDPAHYGVDTDSRGTARGRNAWWKVCAPSAYRMAYPDSRISGIDAEFDTLVSNNHRRRLYPTFGMITGTDAKTREATFTNDVDGKAWVAPSVAPESSGASECMLPQDFDWVGLCTSGCVTPEQEILTANGAKAQAIDQLEGEDEPTVLVPETGASGGSFELTALPVKSFVKDVIAEKQQILVFTTRSGNSVRVSLTHPLLTDSYKMAPADQLKVGDSLIRENGEKDPIVSIQKVAYFGKLHNMYVDTTRMDKSLYVVQGFISGDKRYQDLSVSDINRQALRNLVR